MSGRSRIPRVRCRVVCGVEVVMETFSPTRRLTSVDLPTFGRPVTLTNPLVIVSFSMVVHLVSSGFSELRTLIITGSLSASGLRSTRNVQKARGYYNKGSMGSFIPRLLAFASDRSSTIGSTMGPPLSIFFMTRFRFSAIMPLLGTGREWKQFYYPGIVRFFRWPLMG